MSRVLLTGATGFIGSWTVPALLAAGHEVRVLVRDEQKLARTLAERGLEAGAVEVHRGDILDAEAVRGATTGCSATLHLAAAIAVTSGGQVPVFEQNTVGARTVIGAALAAGHDPIVHVSSVLVFMPSPDDVVSTTSPLAMPTSEYSRSKVDTEREVRALQDEGAPITVLYPGGVFGPGAPALDPGLQALASARQRVAAVMPGGLGIVDVRDVAAALAACVVPGRGPRRLLLGGRYLTWTEVADTLDELTGVRPRRVPVPTRLLVLSGAALDAVRRFRTLPTPLTKESAVIATSMVPTDDRETLGELGIPLTPVGETLAASMRWLVEHGHLAPSAIGRLVAEPPL
jgi:nucleoside-diphosphate-sugar epimerase